MPIYEFYCSRCHTVFNFLSRSVDTEKTPDCPRCRRVQLQRRMSVFSTLRNRGEEEGLTGAPDLDESKMEKAMHVLERDLKGMDEDDPRQAARMMRKLTEMSGMNLGSGMEEALQRLEAGEDPEQVEADMGDLLEEDPFSPASKTAKLRKPPPRVDEKLYEL